MSTYVWMRLLESAPRRYDLGVRILTLGKLERIYDRLIETYVRPGARVLDLGCGTGALTIRTARRGAQVVGIDTNPEMLEVAEARARSEGLSERIELREQGVAELYREPPESYDAITAGLFLSELSDDEIAYTLREVERLLVPGGLLLVADEVRPDGLVRRFGHALLRAPIAAITYLVSGQTSRPVVALPEKIRAAGLRVTSVTWHSRARSFAEVVAQKPAEV